MQYLWTMRQKRKQYWPKKIKTKTKVLLHE